MANQKAPKDIDQYIAGFPPNVRRILGEIRETIRKAAPDAEETISYQMPAFTLEGALVYFAAFKTHIGFYPRTTATAKFKKELSAYKGAKGSVQFPLDKPMPLGLISKIVKFRVRENLEGAETKAKKKSSPRAAAASVEKQLATFIGKFDPKAARLIRACRAEMRKLLPTAIELVYDNYNFFVIGYGSTERASDAIFSIAAAANGVGLAFLHGASLPDPKKLLLGSGKQNRFIRLPSVELLRSPAVLALIRAAVAQARTPLPASGDGYTVIKSVSAKQRPRRKSAKPA